jgi:TPR repeat protein
MTPLKRAADAGHPAAQALYGDILDRAELNDEAVSYLRKAAEQGNADGQYGLAVMYLTGEGVVRDDAEAGRWMRAAAAQDHLYAVIALAKAYINGDERLGAASRRDAAAGPLLVKAAEAGELVAMDALAKAYVSGEYGLEADPAQAELWTARAAQTRAERFGPAPAGKKR